MKKYIFIAVCAMISVFGYIKAEQGDLDTMGYSASGDYSIWRINSNGDLVPGAASTFKIGSVALPVDALYVGAITGSGALTATTMSGTSATFVGTGGVTVSTISTSGQSTGLMGAVVTLSTTPTAVGQLFYQTSDNTMYVSTRVPAANATYCVATGCYAALH